jgi:hypothetical protein
VSETPDGFDLPQSRYIVGIDLGTTNCAVAFTLADDPAASIRSFPVGQWVDLGLKEPQELLPSFHYQPLEEEAPSLGNSSAIVGSLARDRGGQLPGRRIASAKSWLCHAGVDRSSPILPWHCDNGVERLSPVAVSSSYLKCIRQAWDEAHPDQPLENQDVVLTLPASFDQVARQLTIAAAQQAGLQRVMPIEEPQAAFYAWLAKHPSQWESLVRDGQTILVCDIGGGTTDFTLIRVRKSGQAKERDTDRTAPDAAASTLATSSTTEAQSEAAINALHQTRLTLHRVAVGQHLILGGDNIDLALARLAEAKLTGGKSLPPRTWDVLLSACRSAKETLLGENPPESASIHLPGSGARLVGAGTQVEISRQEVEQSVLDGFFPFCPLSQRPRQQESGFREFGLPYAQDAAVTHHLAAFLWDHRTAGRTDEELKSMDEWSQARPDWILFNGGVMTSRQLSHRIVAVVASWFAGKNGLPDDWMPGQLEGERLDLAVAFGAAYFGRVRRGIGVAIEAKLACSYYLQVSENPPVAVCLVPGSASPGDHFKLSEPMELVVGQPVQFPVLYSSTRLTDRVGQSVELNTEDFARLPPIRTVLSVSGSKRREVLPVVLQLELSQIGTLQMWCQAADSSTRWRLEFDIRGSTQSDKKDSVATGVQAGLLDEAVELKVREVLHSVFGEQSPAIKPSKVVAELTQALGQSRQQWSPQILRCIWQTLMDLEPGRKRGPEWESRWLNLLGFALRPGYGMAADDWRVAETWRKVHGKLSFTAPSSRTESQILWRRIAGGFTAGQQLTVYQQIAGPLRQVLDPVRRAKGGGIGPSELNELLRLVGALELLPKSEKAQLGRWVVELLAIPKYTSCHSALYWCIARLGARQLSYGPLNCVVDADEVESWLRRILQKPSQDPNVDLALMQCSRLVQDRYRDLEATVRQMVLEVMASRGCSAHYVQLVQSGGQLAGEEAAQVLGDSLPLGLTLS